MVTSVFVKTLSRPERPRLSWEAGVRCPAVCSYGPGEKGGGDRSGRGGRSGERWPMKNGALCPGLCSRRKQKVGSSLGLALYTPAWKKENNKKGGGGIMRPPCNWLIVFAFVLRLLFFFVVSRVFSLLMVVAATGLSGVSGL